MLIASQPQVGDLLAAYTVLLYIKVWIVSTLKCFACCFFVTTNWCSYQNSNCRVGRVKTRIFCVVDISRSYWEIVFLYSKFELLLFRVRRNNTSLSQPKKSASKRLRPQILTDSERLGCRTRSSSRKSLALKFQLFSLPVLLEQFRAVTGWREPEKCQERFEKKERKKRNLSSCFCSCSQCCWGSKPI